MGTRIAHSSHQNVTALAEDLEAQLNGLSPEFVLFFASSVPHMAGGKAPDALVRATDSAENLSLGKDLFIIKCAKCHRLDRALSARKTPEEWHRTISTMREKDPTWMGESEAGRIADFLISMGS